MPGFFMAIGDNQKVFASKVVSNFYQVITEAIGTPKKVKEEQGWSLVEWHTEHNGFAPDIVHASNLATGTQCVLSGYLTLPQPIARNINNSASLLLSVNQSLDATSIESQIKILSGLNGSFALLSFNRAENTIKLFSDRWASRTIWHDFLDGTWLLASHPLLLWHAAQKRFPVTPAALFSLLLRARPIADHCLLDFGRRNMPGYIHTLYQGGRSDKSRWYRPEYKIVADVSPQEWAQQLTEGLLNSTKRLNGIMKKPLLFLSGGLDSRLALASLTNVFSASSIQTVTLSQGENLATRIARKVAQISGVNNRVILQDRNWYLRGMERSSLLQGGNYHPSHSHFSEALLSMKGNTAFDSVLLGDFLEAFKKLLGDGVDSLEQATTPEHICQSICTLDGQYAAFEKLKVLDFLIPSLRDQVYESWVSKLKSAAKEALETVDNLPLSIDYLLRWRAAFEVATYGMIEDIRCCAPERSLSMDTELHDLILSMPADIRNSGQVATQAITLLMPKLAMTPNANTMLPMGAPAWAHAAAKIMRPKVGKVRQTINQMMKRTSAIRSGSWQDRRLFASTDPIWIEFIEKELNEQETFPDSIFDREKIHITWKKIRGGDLQYGFSLDSLLTFGFIHKHYGSGTIA